MAWTTDNRALRVLVGGVGYPDLCDYSIGILVQEHLSTRDAPSNVTVEDLSYNPIAIIQRLNDEPDGNRFSRVVFVSAVKRGGSPAGAVRCYRWDRVLPSDEEVQRAVTDGVTGIIAVENTLAIAEYFKALPEEVIVIEVEPETHEFGAELSPAVSEGFESTCELVWSCATGDEFIRDLPVQPLAFNVTPLIRFG